MDIDRAADFWKSRKPHLESMLLQSDAVEVDPLERPEVMSYLPDRQWFSVLDLGAGIGRFTKEFASRAKRVTAMDLAPQFIELNRQNNAQFANIDYLVCDARTVRFPKDHFDLVFVSGVFMYLEDQELKELILKIFTWLKKGGYLFVRDCCAPQTKILEKEPCKLRTLKEYHRLMDPLFTLIDSGSIQVYIDRYANPFRCYWLYCKDRVECPNELI